MYKNFLIAGSIALLASCGAEPDATNGICALDCSAPKILGGGGNYEIVALSEAATEFACTGTGTFDSPVIYKFKVVRKDAGDIDYDGNGGVTVPIPEDGGAGVPIAGVGIDVSTSGTIFANDEANNIIQGVGTDPSEWCTDSCGVFTVGMYMSCVDGPGTMTISSGAVATSVAITVAKDTAFTMWEQEVNFKPLN